MKTHQATAKRFKRRTDKVQSNGTKVATFTKCTDGRGHFNARETGKVKRNKRTDNTMSTSMNKTILRSMPHAG